MFSFLRKTRIRTYEKFYCSNTVWCTFSWRGNEFSYRKKYHSSDSPFTSWSLSGGSSGSGGVYISLYRSDTTFDIGSTWSIQVQTNGGTSQVQNAYYKARYYEDLPKPLANVIREVIEICNSACEFQPIKWELEAENNKKDVEKILQETSFSRERG